MPNKDRSFHESPQKAGGEGWLYSEQQQQLCHFKPDTATVHAQWVAIRTYSYVPPRPPEPMTRRRMLRHNAVEAWQTMQKTGWRRCPPRPSGKDLTVVVDFVCFVEIDASLFVDLAQQCHQVLSI